MFKRNVKNKNKERIGPLMKDIYILYTHTHTHTYVRTCVRTQTRTYTQNPFPSNGETTVLLTRTKK